MASEWWDGVNACGDGASNLLANINAAMSPRSAICNAENGSVDEAPSIEELDTALSAETEDCGVSVETEDFANEIDDEAQLDDSAVQVLPEEPAVQAQGSMSSKKSKGSHASAVAKIAEIVKTASKSSAKSDRSNGATGMTAAGAVPVTSGGDRSVSSKTSKKSQGSNKSSKSNKSAKTQGSNDPSVAKSQKSSRTYSTHYSNGSSISSKSASKMNLPQRYAISIASYPHRHIACAMIVSFIMTIAVLVWGNLELRVDASGFFSRGTDIANRAAQQSLIKEQSNKDLLNKVHRPENETINWDEDIFCSGEWYGSETMVDPNQLNLMSIWKREGADDTNDDTNTQKSALDAEALYEMCISEEKTLKVLEDADVCYKCPLKGSTEATKCIQPYSLVGLAKVYLGFMKGIVVPDFLTPPVSCDDLKEEWTTTLQYMFNNILVECSNYMLEVAGQKELENGKFSNCETFPVLTGPIVSCLPDEHSFPCQQS